MMPAAIVIAQKRGRLAHVQHQDVYVTVIVEVAERAAPAGVWLEQGRAADLSHLLKRAVAKVAVGHARGSEFVIRKNFLHFRIDGARNIKDVQPAVVIKVGEINSPANIPG